MILKPFLIGLLIVLSIVSLTINVLAALGRITKSMGTSQVTIDFGRRSKTRQAS